MSNLMIKNHDVYHKVGKISYGKIYDNKGVELGRVGKTEKIEKNTITEILDKWGRLAFKIINDTLCDERDRKIMPVSKILSLFEGHISSNEKASAVAYFCFMIYKG